MGKGHRALSADLPGRPPTWAMGNKEQSRCETVNEQLGKDWVKAAEDRMVVTRGSCHWLEDG